MQTIIGAGGAIGIELAKALKAHTNEIRIVSRNPRRVNETDELFPADVLDPNALKAAIKGSSIVYITVGFPYNLKTWRKNWPSFIDSAIAACELEGCKMVFFDNIYMYDKDSLQAMDEETPINPPSRKGEIRAEVASKVMKASSDGRIRALIARSADFYGPGIQSTSVITETVFKPLSLGKKANWMASVDYKHSFTYTPDAGKATALLGNTDDAYNQVWHLPTAGNPPTGKQWIEMIAEAMAVPPKFQVATPIIVSLMGLFMPIMRELKEMLYQYDRDYVFSSTKFEKRFGIKPTSYEEGINEILKLDYSS